MERQGEVIDGMDALKRCGNGKPCEAEIICDRPAGPHRLCTGFSDDLDEYIDWPNPLWNDDKSHSQNDAEKRIHEMALRLHDRTGSR